MFENLLWIANCENIAQSICPQYLKYVYSIRGIYTSTFYTLIALKYDW